MTQERDYLLDASALLALIFNEPGAELVAGVLDRAAISAVNLAEVITKLASRIGDRDWRSGMVARTLGMLELKVVPWDEAAAVHSGHYAHLAGEGFSLGDRACITQGMMLNAKIVTADKAWKKIPTIAQQVMLVR